MVIRPPVAGTVAPETYDAAGLARNTYTGAISAGWPGRPSGVLVPNFSWSGIVLGSNGVQIGPGATAFTRIPVFSSKNCCARLEVEFWIAALLAASGSNVGVDT